jgi:phenylalanyl-tRNA synthetase alpha chain
MTLLVDDLVSQAQERFAAATDAAALENAKARFLGKEGALTVLLKGLGKLDPEQKREMGARINQAKQQVEELLTARRAALAQAELDARLASETIDVTLPGRGRAPGGIHPVIRTWERVEAIFRSIGFDVADGPEVENDWTNFTALNNPLDHPARSMQDTFYVDMNDADGLPHAQAAHQGQCAGAHLSRRQRRHALAHVPSGGRALDRRGHLVCRSERRVHRFPALLL